MSLPIHKSKIIWTTLAPGQAVKGVIFKGIVNWNSVQCIGTEDNQTLLQQAIEKKHLEIVRNDGEQELHTPHCPVYGSVRIRPGDLIIFNEDNVTVVINPMAGENFYFPFE